MPAERRCTDLSLSQAQLKRSFHQTGLLSPNGRRDLSIKWVDQLPLELWELASTFVSTAHSNSSSTDSLDVALFAFSLDH